MLGKTYLSDSSYCRKEQIHVFLFKHILRELYELAFKIISQLTLLYLIPINITIQFIFHKKQSFIKRLAVSCNILTFTRSMKFSKCKRFAIKFFISFFYSINFFIEVISKKILVRRPTSLISLTAEDVIYVHMYYFIHIF